MKYLAAALFGTLAFASLNLAAAEQTYRGLLKEEGGPVAVTLSVDNAAGAGARVGSVRLGAPWLCGFDLGYVGTQEQVRNYGLIGAGRGRCAVLTQGYLTISPDTQAPRIFLRDQANKAVVTLSVVPEQR